MPRAAARRTQPSSTLYPPLSLAKNQMSQRLRDNFDLLKANHKRQKVDRALAIQTAQWAEDEIAQLQRAVAELEQRIMTPPPPPPPAQVVVVVRNTLGDVSNEDDDEESLMGSDHAAHETSPTTKVATTSLADES